MTLAPDQLDQIRSRIVSQIEELDKEILRLEEAVKPIPLENAIGRVSRMEAINSKSIHEAGLRSARERRIHLKNTLQRLGDDGYGLCARCGQSIPFKRLSLMPESRMCVGCVTQ